MGKRLIRIPKEAVLGKLPELIDKVIDVVDANGVVTHGKLKSKSADSILMMDARSHKHEIAISEITEVIFDHSSES